MPTYQWDENKLDHRNPEIDLRDGDMAGLLLANGVFWGLLNAFMVAVVLWLVRLCLKREADGQILSR